MMKLQIYISIHSIYSTLYLCKHTQTDLNAYHSITKVTEALQSNRESPDGRLVLLLERPA